ncbi:MAG: tetratricopeptide repeat protein [Planctomycetia bacterium]|nr:tetratricopeptide repeat protein [Planctomycetia bacterium]
MVTISRRDFLVNLAEGFCLVAASSQLNALMANASDRLDGGPIRWIMTFPEEVEGPMRLYNGLMVSSRAPKSVKIIMNKYGTTINEQTKEEDWVIGFEAQPLGPLSEVTETALRKLGFEPFQQCAVSDLNAALQQCAVNRGSTLDDFKAAIQREPNFAVAYYNRGTSYLQLDQNDSALSDLQKATELDPSMYAARVDLGLVLTRLRRWTEAIQVYVAAIEAQPTHAMAYNNLAWLYATSPDPAFRDGQKAVALALTSVQLSSGFSSFTCTLAAAYAEAGNFAEAMRVQCQLVSSATTPQQEHRYRERLALYEAKKPYRETYRALPR